MNLTVEQQTALTGLAESANEKLEAAGQASAQLAFNLGCSAALIPGLALAAIVFLLTRAGWVTAFIILIITLLAAVLFANLAAYLAKSRSIERVYAASVGPEIERALKGLDFHRSDFDHLAATALGPDAALQHFLMKPEEDVQNADL